jgi:hypothetical protein
MQLKQNKKKSKNNLAMAAASLIAATSLPSVSVADWSHEASLLYYGESDSRVQDGSLKYKGVRTSEGNKGDNTLTLNIGIDTLTGASPSGVTPSNEVQVLTSPSGKGTITHPAGKLPLDNTFKDTRLSVSGNWEQPIINESIRANLGGSFSKEYDYLHLGISGGLSKELNNKNTKFSVGLAFSADTFDPVGNAPIPLSDQNAAKGKATNAKNTLDAVFGVTQVLSKKSILQLNYGISAADGYLNDPYKWVSRVDKTGKIIANLHESRPDSRTGHNVFGAMKQTLFGDNVLTTSARLHTDNWGVNSYTLDVKYRVGLSNRKSIEPHLRYYHQTAADFYRPQLDASATLPEYATADYRLAEFDAYTLGATYRWRGENNREWRLTGEFYTQKPTTVKLTTGQAGLNANPGFDAIMLSLGVSF